MVDWALMWRFLEDPPRACAGMKKVVRKCHDVLDATQVQGLEYHGGAFCAG
jgi:D-mannonate dehydratase